MRPFIALAFLAAALIGCSSLDSDADPDPGMGALVWVAKSYVGGEQCADIRFQPPSPTAELEQVGVEVYGAAIEHGVACAACGCPSYVALHYAQIRESNLERAASAGFERSDPPSRE